MKKIALIASIMLTVGMPALGQTKSELKAARKEAKAAAKLLKRDGFKPLELGDVQTRLEKYFLKVNAGCAQVIGVAENCMSTNLAQVTALSNAANQYAMLAGGDVRGRIVSSTTSLTGSRWTISCLPSNALWKSTSVGNWSPILLPCTMTKGT